MAGNDINLKIGATDKTGTAFKSAETKMMSMAGAAKKMTSMAGGVFGGVAAAGAIRAGVKSFVDFDTAVREVNSLMGLSGKDFKALETDIMSVSKTLGVDAVTAAKAAYQAISAGIPREGLVDFLTTASKAGIAGLVDTETSVNALTNAVNAYGLSSGSAGSMADMMFEAVKQGKTTFGELSESMYIAAPMASQLGVKFEELMASVAAITKRGAPTSAAFNQIQASMVALVKPTDNMSRVLEQLGFKTGQEILAAKGYQGALQSIRTKASDMGLQLATVMGRVEAQNAVFNLSGTAAEEYGRILRETGNASGAMSEAFEINNDSAGRAIDRLTTKIKNFSIMVVENIATSIEAVQKLSQFGLEKSIEGSGWYKKQKSRSDSMDKLSPELQAQADANMQKNYAVGDAMRAQSDSNMAAIRGDSVSAAAEEIAAAVTDKASVSAKDAAAAKDPTGLAANRFGSVEAASSINNYANKTRDELSKRQLDVLERIERGIDTIAKAETVSL